AISNTVPFGVCGGIQDDNAACGPSNSLAGAGIWGADWWNPSGGDGTYVVPAPSDPAIVYAASQNGYTSRIDTRNMTSTFVRPVMEDMSDTPISQLDHRFNWASPIAVSPTDPDTVYIGSNVLFKSTDGGASWTAISKDLTRDIKEHQPIAGGPVFHDISSAENTDTILSISLAPTNPGVIWVGTGDGLVWVSKDGGANWANVSAGLPQAVSLGRIYQIGVSPFDAGTAYIAVDGHMLGDEHPYVLKTSDYGGHWHGIADGLPDNHAAVVVREDPNRKGLLALGTMRGLYLSFDDGARWHAMTGNLPTMGVWDIKFTRSPHDIVLATHGYGLWILDNIEPLEQWQPRMADASFNLFPSTPGTEWMEFGGRHIGPPPGEFKTPNPPSGPAIVYSLAKAMDVPKACAKEDDKDKSDDESSQETAGPRPKGDVQKKGEEKQGKPEKKKPSFEQCNPAVVTVTDRAGKPVASFHAPGKAGINVASWNMRYTGIELPKELRAEERPDEDHGPKGPLALPGSYQVRIDAGDHDANVTVQVVADQRVNPPMDVQRAAFDTAMKLRDEAAADVAMIGRSYDMMQALDKVLDSTADAAPDSAKANAHASAQMLKATLGDFSKDFWNPDIQYKVLEDDLHQITPWGMSFFGVYRGALDFGPNQAPNANQRQYIAKMEAGLQPRLDAFNGSLRQAVLDFNKQAKSAGVQTLAIGDPVKIGDPKLLAPAE
ncbi:MAG: WD40/YVTN/BNR-like repeat-containing protein, partial [Rhodanobacteraceae bacterium]